MGEWLKNQLFVSHAIAAVGSVTVATAVTYPLDTIKVLIQVSSAFLFLVSFTFSSCNHLLILHYCFVGDGDQVGSNSGKQLTSLQALNRVRSLSGNSGTNSASVDYFFLSVSR